jgi:transposase InsO family protein
MTRISLTGCLPAASVSTENHEFDQLCQALNIEHRLIKPRTPQTNGMVERFNGGALPMCSKPIGSPVAKIWSKPAGVTWLCTTINYPDRRTRAKPQ